MIAARILVLAGFLHGLAGLPAVAQTAAAFDGTWQLQGARTADPFCSQLTWRTLTVQQGNIVGTLGHTRGTFNLTGQVAPDGKATFFADGPFGHLGRGSGQFTAATASGSIRFNSPDVFCEIGWTSTRRR
jgi:hypothetical protein